jgi:predicted acylesterase/phospholipase RssA
MKNQESTNDSNKYDCTDVINPNKEFCDKVKHLVISGGVVYGYAFYGCLRRLAEKGFWHIDNIISIHSTSVGTIFATIFALRYDWDTVNDYVVDRPWHTVFKIDMCAIMNCYSNRGIFPMDIIDKVFMPLFSAKDIPIDITMKEFFNITGIELHYNVTSITNFELIDISHLTHPDWKVMDAIYASCSAPIFFAPLVKDGTWYADGGFILNYPVDNCLNSRYKPKEEEIIGIKMNCVEIELNIDNTSLFEYIACLFIKFITKFTGTSKKIKNEILISQLSEVTSYDIHALVSSPQKRMRLIEHGIQIADDFIRETNASSDASVFNHINSDSIETESLENS